MKKLGLGTIAVILFAFLLNGCATLDRLLPKDLQDTKNAIEQARLSGADKNCPEEYQKVVAMWNEAMEIYRSCRTKEAIAKAKAAREKATMLCEARKDSDSDGVFDDIDACPDTPRGVKVDEKGCPLDSDGDGVLDYKDQCPNTPGGVKVDEKGCPIDSDGDGVADYLDKCPNTPSGVRVDAKGCPLDTDGDGVYDYLDRCPGTPKAATVNDLGCWVLEGVLFDTAKWNIKPQSYQILNEVVEVLKRNPYLKVEVQGHTDSRGKTSYNQRLSENRARAVMDYFLKKGLSKDRFSFVGYASTRPIGSNLTPEGRAKNRRVELTPIP